MGVQRPNVVRYDDLLRFGLERGYARQALLALWRMIPKDFVRAIPEGHRMKLYTAQTLTPWDQAQPVQRDEGVAIEKNSLLDAANHLDANRVVNYGPRRQQLFEAWVTHLRR